MARRPLLFVPILSALLAVGCTPSATRRAPALRSTPDLPPSASAAQRAAWRKGQTTEIYEAVLRRGLELYGPHFVGERWQKRLPECTLFVSVAERDPTDTLLQRFAGERPAIRKGSEWDQLPTAKHWEFFGQTARSYLSSIVWESDTRAQVTFSAWVGPRGGAWWNCSVLRRDGRWIVTTQGPRVT